MGLVHRLLPPLQIGAQSQFVRNVGTTLAAQGASLVLSIISAALVARFLGPEGKGMFALALIIPGFLAMLLNGGVGVANVYMVGSGRLTLRQASRASISFIILACLAGALIVGVLIATGWLGALVPGFPIGLQMLVMALLPLNVLDGYLGTLLRGLQRIATLNVVTAATAAINALGVALFVGTWRLGIIGAIGATFAGGLLSAFSKALILARMGAKFRPSWDPTTMHSMIGFGLRGQVGNILQFFNYRMDTFVLNYFHGPSHVGIYGAAVAMAELLWQLPNAVSFVIFPKAAATRATDLNAFTPRVFKVTLLLTAAGGVVLALGGRTFIEWVFSSAFAEAYVPLLGLLPGVVLLGGSKVLANEMAGRGYPHYNSAVSGTVLIVTVLLDILLIPRLGAMGAALASSVAYALSFVLSLILYGMLFTGQHRPHSAEALSSVP